MTYWEIVLVALTLSVDTLAVTVSGSLTLRQAPRGRILGVALAFGLIQSALLFVGWACGASVMSLIYSVAGWLGFALLLYIGGSMILGALRREERKAANLDGFTAILLAGVATSIDASAVGLSYAMASIAMPTLYASLAVTFLVTAIVALTGIFGGCRIGCRFGRPAQIVGGIVLIVIGFRVLLS